MNARISSPRAWSAWALVLGLASVLALLGLAACSDGGGGTSPTETGESDGDGGTGTTTGTGRLRIEMTDAPVDEVSQLVVWVSGLKVKPHGEPTAFIDANLGAYDLLLLESVSVLLADAQVAAGAYEFIEIHLDESQSFVVTVERGEQMPLRIASDKIKLAGGPFEVLRDGTTSVLFDFDAERSLRQLGNGDWLLRPFVEILEVTVTGT